MLARTQIPLLDFMPHFIAVNYQTMMKASNDHEAIQAGLATFERCLRFLTIVLVSQYLVHDRDDVSDPYLNRQLVKGFISGDLRSWTDVLITTLKAYQGHPEWLFVPEMYEFYWDTSDPERHRPRISMEQTINRLISLSNDWRDGKNLPNDTTSWSFLANEVNSLINGLLKSLAFWANYELICVSYASESGYVAKRHVGLTITEVKFECQKRLQPNWYYLSKRYDDFLLLDPLLMSWNTEQYEIAIFQRLTSYHKLRYLLTLTGKLIFDTAHLEQFMALLDEIEHVKQVMRRKEDMTWLQVTATMAEITNSQMAAVTSKFDETVYLQRRGLLNLFNEFMASDAHCFVLTGKSGSGKSNFVLSLCSEYKDNTNVSLLMIDASQIGTDKGLTAFINDAFWSYWGLNSEESPNIWEEINRLTAAGDRTVLLVLDAINESISPQDLLRQTDKLIRQPWKWLKILITSRPETWRRICYGQHLAESLFFQVRLDTDLQMSDTPHLSAYNMYPFSEDELRVVYKFYQDKYCIRTPYESLSLEVRQLLREPLQLWMTARANLGKDIPRVLPTGRLVEYYIDALLDTGRLRFSDVHFLQNELMPLMMSTSEGYTNVITVAAIEQAGERLLNQIFNEGYYSTGEQVSSSFQQLVDAQIIVLHIQGLTSTVQFKYEHFYDHFLGEYLYKKISQCHSGIVEEFRLLIAKAKSLPFIWGVVQTAFYKALQDGKIDEIKQLCVADDPTLTYLLVPVLSSYAQENLPRVHSIVCDLLNISPPRLLLERAKYPRDLLKAKEIAIQTAYNLEDTQALTYAICDRSNLVSDIGIKFTYALGQRNSQKALTILNEVGQRSIGWGLPHFSVVRAFASLAVLLMTEHMQEELSGGTKELMDVILKTARQMSHVKQGRLQIVGNRVRAGLSKIFLQYVLTLLNYGTSIQKESGDRTTTVNLDELAAFYNLPKTKRQTALDLAQYLDRTHATSFSELEDVLLTSLKDRNVWNMFMGGVIGSVYGSLKPDWAQEVCHKIYDCDDGSGEIHCVALGVWYKALNRQSEIQEAWLDSGKELFRKYMDDSRHGYGRYITPTLTMAQIYPLIFYIALYNKKYPYRPNDLVEYYLECAERTHNRALLLHIIDSIGDRRAYLINYPPVLSSLTPYIRGDEEILSHLISSLANIRGIFPDQVDRFLLHADSPKQFVEAVRRQSYEVTTLALYTRMSDFLVDLLIYGNEFVRTTFVKGATLMIGAKNHQEALKLAVHLTLNSFYGQRVL